MIYLYVFFAGLFFGITIVVVITSHYEYQATAFKIFYEDIEQLKEENDALKRDLEILQGK